jgi:hypothetical protein
VATGRSDYDRSANRRLKGESYKTEALFEKVEVPGVKSVTMHPTPEADAHRRSEAFDPTPQLITVEMVATLEGTDGRGERSRADTSQQFPLRFGLAAPYLADCVAVGS